MASRGYVPPAILLRIATGRDLRPLWRIRNEQTARYASFNQSYIPLKQHAAWMERKLAEGRTVMFTVSRPHRGIIGYVRFEPIRGARDSWKISLALAPSERGRGLGVLAIQYGCRLLHAMARPRRIVAYIPKENWVSFRAFQKARFRLRGSSIQNGRRHWRLIHTFGGSARSIEMLN
ncbi:MAG: GNAT family N-acetyltransferase [Nitrospirae bacterium]|nr:GNAT family N-acetyltransferase [Nitrospirota bacterium]